MKLPILKMNEKNPIIFQTTTEIPMSLFKQVNDNHMQKNKQQQQQHTFVNVGLQFLYFYR